MPVVEWGNGSLSFDLPQPNTALAVIRHDIALHLPYDAFLLVYDGAVMCDDNATVSSYHLCPDSTLTIVTPETSSFKNAEQAQIASIQTELSTVDNSLHPALTGFLSQLTPQTRLALEKDHARISELLMQALIRLDAIIPEYNWTNARANRKLVVNKLQSLLDQLDSAWAAAAQGIAYSNHSINHTILPHPDNTPTLCT